MRSALLAALLLLAPLPAAGLGALPEGVALVPEGLPPAPEPLPSLAADPPAGDGPAIGAILAAAGAPSANSIEPTQLLACLRWPGPIPAPPPVPVPLPLPALGAGPQAVAPVVEAIGKALDAAGLPDAGLDGLPRALYALRATSTQGQVAEYLLPPTAVGPVDVALGFPLDLDGDDAPDACAAMVIGSTFDRQMARVWSLRQGPLPGASVAFVMAAAQLAPQDGGSLFALGLDGGVPSRVDLTFRLDDGLRRMALSAAFEEPGAGHALSAWRSDVPAGTVHAAAWSAATHGTGVRLVSEPGPRAARAAVHNTDPASGLLESAWTDASGASRLGVAADGAHRALHLALDDTDGRHLRARGGATPAGAHARASWAVEGPAAFRHELGFEATGAGWVAFETPGAVRMASSALLDRFLDRTDAHPASASVAWDAATGALDVDVPLVRHLRAASAGLDADVVIEGHGPRDLRFRGTAPGPGPTIVAARAADAGQRIGWSSQGGDAWRFDADQPTARLDWVVDDGAPDLVHASALRGPLLARLDAAGGEVHLESPGYDAALWLAHQEGPWQSALLQAGAGGSVRAGWTAQATAGALRTYVPGARLSDARLLLTPDGSTPAPAIGPHVVREAVAAGSTLRLDLPSVEEFTWDRIEDAFRLDGALPQASVVDRAVGKERIVSLERVDGPVEVALRGLDLSARAWPSLKRLVLVDGDLGVSALGHEAGFRTFDATLATRNPAMRLLADQQVLSVDAHRTVLGEDLWLGANRAHGASLEWPAAGSRWTFRVPGPGNATILTASYATDGDSLFPPNKHGFRVHGPAGAPWQLLLRGTDGADVDWTGGTLRFHATSRWLAPVEARMEHAGASRHAEWSGPAQDEPRAVDALVDFDHRFAYAMDGDADGSGSAYLFDPSGTPFRAILGGPRAGAHLEGGLGVLGVRSTAAHSGLFERTGEALHGGSYDVVRVDLDGAADGIVAGFRQDGRGLVAAAAGPPVGHVALDLGPALVPEDPAEGLLLARDGADDLKGPFMQLRARDFRAASGLAGAASDAWGWDAEEPALLRSEVRGDATRVTVSGTTGAVVHSPHRLGVDLAGVGTVDALWCSQPFAAACPGTFSSALLQDAQPGRTLSLHAPDRIRVDGADPTDLTVDPLLRVEFGSPKGENLLHTQYAEAVFRVRDLHHDPDATFATLHDLRVEAKGPTRLDLHARSAGLLKDDDPIPLPGGDHLFVQADRAKDERRVSVQGSLASLRFCGDCEERLYEVRSERAEGPGRFRFFDYDEFRHEGPRAFVDFPLLSGLGALSVATGPQALRTELRVAGDVPEPVAFGYAHLPLGYIQGTLAFPDDDALDRVAAVTMAKWTEPTPITWTAYSAYPNIHMSLAAGAPVLWDGEATRTDHRQMARMTGQAVLVPAPGAAYVHGHETKNYLTKEPLLTSGSASAVWNTCHICIRLRDTNTHTTADETRYVFEQAIESATLHADLRMVRNNGVSIEDKSAHYVACGWDAVAHENRRMAIGTYWDRTQQRFETLNMNGNEKKPWTPAYFHGGMDDLGEAFVEGRWYDPEPAPFGETDPRHLLPVHLPGDPDDGVVFEDSKGHGDGDHCTPTLALP